MALIFDATFAPTLTKGGTLFREKALRKLAGWVVKASGDGLSAFSSTTDILTSNTSGANGWQTNAWYRIQDPAGVREFCIQYSDKIKYSRSAKFTGGSPSATVMPTATDEQYTMGSAGAGGSWLTATDNTYRWVAACDNAAPYGMYSIAWPVGSSSGASTFGGVFLFDPLISGTYPVADADPYVIYTPSSGIAAFQANTSFVGNCWFLAGLTGATFTTVTASVKGMQVGAARDLLPGGLGTDPYTHERISGQVHWTRGKGQTSPIGQKGYASFLKTFSIKAQQPGVTFGEVSSRDRICFSDFSLPWNGTKVAL